MHGLPKVVLKKVEKILTKKNRVDVRCPCDEMTETGKTDNWAALSLAEKKLELFRRQKDLLDTFLTTGAISQAQHDKSLNCLIEKMGIDKDEHGDVL